MTVLPERNEAIDHLASSTAIEASDFTHGLLGWQLAQEGETIPYQAIFVMRRKPSHDDVIFAKEPAGTF